MKKIRLSVAGIIAVVCCLHSIAALGLERLFTTRAERAQLDAGRFQTEITNSAALSEAPKRLTVDGVVLRRDRRNQVWVNGLNFDSVDQTVGYSANQKRARYNSVPIHLIGKSADIILRPGETYLVESGITKDAYEWQPEASVLDAAAAAISDEKLDIAAETPTEKSTGLMESP